MYKTPGNDRYCMHDLLSHITTELLPLIITGVLHMLAVKYRWLPQLARPLWLRGFGAHKTWRGLLFMTFVNGLTLLLLSLSIPVRTEHPFALGALLGLAYAAFELPNSWLKRRIGIAAGEHHLKYKYVFYLIDKTDSSFGVALVYYLVSGISLVTAGELFVVNCLTHALIALALVIAHIKSRF